MSFFRNEKGWPLVPLKDVATLKRGYDLPVQNRIPGDVPVYAANGCLDFHSEVKVNRPGVVTGRSGTIGKVHFVDSDYWPLNTALYVQNFHGNDPKWVYYMLQAFRLERFVEGAGVPTLNRNLVHDELIPLPPLAEQKRIAAILDKADALRRKRQQAIELADQFLRSVFLDMFGDPVTNPKGWETRLMSELVRLQGGFAFKSSDFVDAGIPVVKIGNANKGEFDITNLSFMAEDNSPSMKKYELFEGDMLLTLTGTVGKDDYGNVTRVPAGYDKWYLNQRVAKIELCSGAVNSSYIEYLLSSPEIKKEIIKASRGVRQANISNSDVYSLRVPVPNKQSQDQFEGIVKQLIATRTKLKLMIPQLEVFFGSLSQQAFNGKL